VLGFSAIFVGLGTAASGIERLLYDYRGLLTKVGGTVIVRFGLAALGLLRIP
jgi:cytochrome c-type biogenesis protein